MYNVKWSTTDLNSISIRKLLSMLIQKNTGDVSEIEVNEYRTETDAGTPE